MKQIRKKLRKVKCRAGESVQNMCPVAGGPYLLKPTNCTRCCWPRDSTWRTRPVRMLTDAPQGRTVKDIHGSTVLNSRKATDDLKVHQQRCNGEMMHPCTKMLLRYGRSHRNTLT